MDWLRNKRGLAWLALFALLVQITFTFGHVHDVDDDIRGRLALTFEAFADPSDLSSEPASPLVASTKALEPNQPSSPFPEHDEENCLTCWLLGLVGSFVLPGNVDIVRDTLFSSVDYEQGAHVFVLAPVRRSYQVRAPPFI